MPSSQQLRPKCQNQVGVILAQFLGSRRALDVDEPAGTARAPLSPAIRRPAQRQRHHPFVLLWIAAQRTFQSSAERFRPSALTQMAPGHSESIRARQYRHMKDFMELLGVLERRDEEKRGKGSA